MRLEVTSSRRLDPKGRR